MREPYVRVALLVSFKIKFEIKFEISYHLVFANSEGDKPQFYEFLSFPNNLTLLINTLRKLSF